MIVILCDSFDDAKEAFEIFLDYLNWECYVIQNNYKACYCVETDDDLRYIFIDYRMKNIFKDMTPDFLDVEEFFEDLLGYYSERSCRGYDGGDKNVNYWSDCGLGNYNGDLGLLFACKSFGDD